MKQIYTLILAAAAVSMPAVAGESHIYFPDGGETLGNVGGISANGRYAAIYDDENNLGYLWDAENPDELIMLPGKCQAFDVSNDGVVAGSVYFNEGGQVGDRPAIYVNGEWKRLPVHETTANTAFARRITPDGKAIGGILCVLDESVETGKGYRACSWKLNAQGEYELTSYNELPAEVAHHQGFWMNDMTDDGNVIVGFIMCGATQCTIPAYVKDGQYYYPEYSIEAREEPAYYKDQIIGYFTEYYINGFHDIDTSYNIQGQFATIDQETGNCYGMRTRVFDVQEDGSATLVSGACVFNLNTGEYTVDDTNNGVYYGCDHTGGLFLSYGDVLIDGASKSLGEAYGVTYTENIVGAQETSADGNVIGGCHSIMNPATGTEQYMPFIIVRNDDASVDVIGAGVDNAVEINVTAGRIEVSGTDNVAVYDMQGRLVSNAASTSVEAGAYIVKAGDTTRKVLVK